MEFVSRLHHDPTRLLTRVTGTPLTLYVIWIHAALRRGGRLSQSALSLNASHFKCFGHLNHRTLVIANEIGTRGGIRTLNPLRATDFKSVVYTVPPLRLKKCSLKFPNYVYIIHIKLGKFKLIFFDQVVANNFKCKPAVLDAF